ncbi:P-loop containing nucleoside triphosphate hydrolase protein [Auriculariales sp. MPI-PUGE-AT-0066]|nr:P-loop containing nucleoside triphosphate hydrolase protein [Auriculariales sp. MPI-PUGE-AT-0066]
MPVSFSPPSSWKNGIPPIIVVVGQSGAGKSDFINHATGNGNQAVGHTLASETSHVTLIDCTVRGKVCALIDCPGFDDTGDRSDVSIFNELAGYIHAIDPTGGHNHITGILFVHRISDNRFTTLQSRIARTIAKICGEPAMKNAVICTTHWDTIPEKLGKQRLTELREKPGWSQMVQNGTKTVRHSNKSDYAWADSSVTPQKNAQNIIRDMLKNGPVPLQIIEELKRGTKLVNTAAGQVISEDIRKYTKKAQQEIADVKREMEQAQHKMAHDLKKAQERTEQARRDVEAAHSAKEKALRRQAADALKRKEKELERANNDKREALREEKRHWEHKYKESEMRRKELQNSRGGC